MTSFVFSFPHPLTDSPPSSPPDSPPFEGDLVLKRTKSSSQGWLGSCIEGINDDDNDDINFNINFNFKQNEYGKENCHSGLAEQ